LSILSQLTEIGIETGRKRSDRFLFAVPTINTKE